MTVLLDHMFMFVYKTFGFFNYFEKQCSTDIESTDSMKMLESLARCPCAAKSLDVVWYGAMGSKFVNGMLNITQVLSCLLTSPGEAWHLLTLHIASSQVHRGG